MTERFQLAGVIVSCGLLTAALAGCNRDVPAAANQGAAASAVQRVTLGKPERKTLTLSTTQPGQIEALEQTPLFAKVAGYADEVQADIGDVVKKDQTLIKIAVPELHDDLAQRKAAVAQVEAEVKQAEASVVGAKAAVASAEARVAQAEAGIGRAEAEFRRWESESKRVQELAAGRAVTEKLAEETLNQFRAADASRREAAAAVQSARAGLEEAQVGVNKAEADVGAAKARLGVAQAELARATTLLKYTEIKAPFDGVVTRRLIDTGHYVSPPGGASAQPLMVVCRTDVVRVFVDVPELEAEWVDGGEQGDPAEVRVQASGNRTFAAKVTRSAWALDPKNRSLRVEIDVPNPGGVLRPGMFATATITLERRPDVVTLPTAAVVREGADTFCCTVSDGKIERRKIEVGLRSGADVEIRSGLDPNQAVVIAQAAALKPGQAVQVAEPEKK